MCPGGSASASATAHVAALTTVQDTGGALLFAVSGNESGSVTESGLGRPRADTTMAAHAATNVDFTVSGAASQLTCTLTLDVQRRRRDVRVHRHGVPVPANPQP